MHAEQIAKLKEATQRVREYLDARVESKQFQHAFVHWIGAKNLEAEDLRALLDAVDLAERTTSPVSQMTDEQIDAIWENMPGFDVKDGIELREFAKAKRTEFARAILAAAAPAAPGPDPAPIYKHRDDGTVTLTNTGKMPSYADIDKVAWKIHEAHAAQPQPVAEQGAQRIHPPEFPKFCASSIEGTMSPEDLWDYACLTGWRTGHFAASQQAAEPVAWQFEENTHPDRRAGGGRWERRVEHTFRPESFIEGSVRNVRPLVYGDAAPAIQQSQDERAAFEAWAESRFIATCRGQLEEYGNPYANKAWEAWQARAALAKKGGAA